jgi:outer membrane protein
MTFKTFLAVFTGLAAFGATHAAAADLGKGSQETYADPYVVDDSAGWMIRARVLDVVSDEASSSSAGSTKVDYSLVPEVDFSYFFNKHFAIELIAGVTKDDISATTPYGTFNVGEAWMAPVMIALQYHFDVGHGIQPYVGAGVNYTVFFHEKGGDFGPLEIDNGLGWALQAGVDIHLRDNWYLNFDVKKLWLDTSATSGGVKADVNVEPLIVGAGIGYRFGGAAEALK